MSRGWHLLCRGLEGASAPPQDRRCGLGQAGPSPGPWATASAADLGSAGGWGPAGQRPGATPSVPGQALLDSLTDGLILPVSGRPLLKPWPDALPGARRHRQRQRWPTALPRRAWSACPVPPASRRGKQGQGSRGALSSAEDEGRPGQAQLWLRLGTGTSQVTLHGASPWPGPRPASGEAPGLGQSTALSRVTGPSFESPLPRAWAPRLGRNLRRGGLCLQRGHGRGQGGTPPLPPPGHPGGASGHVGCWPQGSGEQTAA